MEEPGSGETDRADDVDDAAVVTRTFLIADVRGHTRYTQTHGDEEAGKLAATFAALARATVTAIGGALPPGSTPANRCRPRSTSTRPSPPLKRCSRP